MTARQLYTLAPMVLDDERDAYLMGLYTQGRAKLIPAKRMMLLSGLADFQRVITAA